jgi:hypothetical protein
MGEGQMPGSPAITHGFMFIYILNMYMEAVLFVYIWLVCVVCVCLCIYMCAFKLSWWLYAVKFCRANWPCEYGGSIQCLRVCFISIIRDWFNECFSHILCWYPQSVLPTGRARSMLCGHKYSVHLSHSSHELPWWWIQREHPKYWVLTHIHRADCLGRLHYLCMYIYFVY